MQVGWNMQRGPSLVIIKGFTVISMHTTSSFRCQQLCEMNPTQRWVGSCSVLIISFKSYQNSKKFASAVIYLIPKLLLVFL